MLEVWALTRKEIFMSSGWQGRSYIIPSGWPGADALQKMQKQKVYFFIYAFFTAQLDAPIRQVHPLRSALSSFVVESFTVEMNSGVVYRIWQNSSGSGDPVELTHLRHWWVTFYMNMFPKWNIYFHGILANWKIFFFTIDTYVSTHILSHRLETDGHIL